MNVDNENDRLIVPLWDDDEKFLGLVVDEEDDHEERDGMLRSHTTWVGDRRHRGFLTLLFRVFIVKTSKVRSDFIFEIVTEEESEKRRDNSVGILLRLLCFRKEEKRGKLHTKVLNDQITVVIDQIEAPRLKRFGHETAQHVHHFFHWLFIHHRQLFYQSYNWTKISYKRKYKQFKLLRKRDKRERERESEKTSSFPTFRAQAEKQTDNTGSTCWSTSIKFWW